MMQAATTDSEKVSASNRTRIGAMIGGFLGNLFVFPSLFPFFQTSEHTLFFSYFFIYLFFFFDSVTITCLMALPHDASIGGLMTNGITVPVFFCMFVEASLLGSLDFPHFPFFSSSFNPNSSQFLLGFLLFL